GVEPVDPLAEGLAGRVEELNLEGGVAGRAGSVVLQRGVEVEAVRSPAERERVEVEHPGAARFQADLEVCRNDQRVVVVRPARGSIGVAPAVDSAEATGGAATTTTTSDPAGARRTGEPASAGRITLPRAARRRAGRGEERRGREDDESLRQHASDPFRKMQA